MTKPKKKQKSGGARDTENGLGTIILTATAEEKAIIRQAAELDGRSMRNYSLRCVLAQAKKDISEKMEK